jgi:hypothetical protein
MPAKLLQNRPLSVLRVAARKSPKALMLHTDLIERTHGTEIKTNCKCNSWQTPPRISHQARGRAAHRGAKQNRSGHRDATAILDAYRHGPQSEWAMGNRMAILRLASPKA